MVRIEGSCSMNGRINVETIYFTYVSTWLNIAVLFFMSYHLNFEIVLQICSDTLPLIISIVQFLTWPCKCTVLKSRKNITYWYSLLCQIVAIYNTMDNFFLMCLINIHSNYRTLFRCRFCITRIEHM